MAAFRTILKFEHLYSIIYQAYKKGGAKEVLLVSNCSEKEK